METWELNEKKKEYLNGYKYAKRREKRIREQIQQLRLDAMFPCLQGDGMPRGSSQSDLSNYMEKYEDLMGELKKERLEAVKEYTEIHRAIKEMKDEEEKEILERKYLMRQTWEEIAEELGCDRRTAIRKHGNALKNFEIPESCHCMSL
ncbi:MAG TPA: DUF1492 domain-containing protein [Candidatus Mediterraneibacter excrementigallinarum]|nr:DUF1492 domain-containing protein [Candidatus Mediterraneibacter excrementigallinarum]